MYDYDQYNYSAEADHQTYLRNRQNSGRHPKWLICDSFINWEDDQMLDKGWSPDMVFCHYVILSSIHSITQFHQLKLLLINILNLFLF